MYWVSYSSQSLVSDMATATLSITFPCGLRRFHVYRNIWSPVLDKVLCTIHESSNPHDSYAIAVRKKLTWVSTCGVYSRSSSKGDIQAYEIHIVIWGNSYRQGIGHKPQMITFSPRRSRDSCTGESRNGI